MSIHNQDITNAKPPNQQKFSFPRMHGYLSQQTKVMRCSTCKCRLCQTFNESSIICKYSGSASFDLHKMFVILITLYMAVILPMSLHMCVYLLYYCVVGQQGLNFRCCLISCILFLSSSNLAFSSLILCILESLIYRIQTIFEPAYYLITETDLVQLT